MFFKRNIHLTKTIYDQFRWCGKPPGHHFEKKCYDPGNPLGEPPGLSLKNFPDPRDYHFFCLKKMMSPPFPDRVLVYH